MLYFILEQQFGGIYMIKIIHTGDLHIGVQFKNTSFDGIQSKKRRIELWETFERILKRAYENKPDFLIISGDLFEEDYFTMGDIKRIRDGFNSIKGVNVVISAGNHDPLDEKSLYNLVQWPENVYIFHNEKLDKKEFDSLNTVIWGYSWKEKEEKKRLFDDLDNIDKDKINVLVLHGDILNKDSPYLPLDMGEIERLGFDYVALGHIHKPQFLKDRISYCGSPEPLDFGETGIHGIVEGEIEKGRVSLKLIPFSKRIFVNKEIDVSHIAGFSDVIQAIKNIDDENSRRKNFYRLTLKGIMDRDINLDLEEIKEILKDEFYHIEIINCTTPDYDLDKLLKENNNNIIGIFIKEMMKKGLEDPIVKDGLYLGLKILLKEKMGE